VQRQQSSLWTLQVPCHSERVLEAANQLLLLRKGLVNPVRAYQYGDGESPFGACALLHAAVVAEYPLWAQAAVRGLTVASVCITAESITMSLG